METGDNWYYESVPEQQAGPVSAEEFSRLKSAGAVTPDTRVWKKGMGDWEPLREVEPQAASQGGGVGSGGAPPLDPGAVGKCAELFQKSELLEYGDVSICVGCKPKVIDKLQMGMRLGQGIWRNGKDLVVEHDRELPQRCVKCNAAATQCYKRKLIWTPPWVHHAAGPLCGNRPSSVPHHRSCFPKTGNRPRFSL